MTCDHGPDPVFARLIVLPVAITFDRVFGSVFIGLIFLVAPVISLVTSSRGSSLPSLVVFGRGVCPG